MAHEHSSDARNRGDGDGSSTALHESAERLKVALSSAFPPVTSDGLEDAEKNESVVDVPIDDKLLTVVPPAPPIDFDSLAAEVSRHRRLIVRAGAVVSVAALLSIAGTFFFHAGLLGVAGLLWFKSTTNHASQEGGGAGGNSSNDGVGYLITDDSLGQPAGSELHASLLKPSSGFPSAPGALTPPPPIVQPLPGPGELAMNQLNGSQPDFGIIAIPAGDSITGQIKTHTAPVSPRPAPLPQNILVAPDPSARPSETIAHGGGGISPTGVGNANGDDEEPVSWEKPGAGGSSGKRKGSGHGYTSGALRSEPSVKDWPWPTFNFKNPPQKNPRFTVTVRADGSIAKVELAESCGQSDIDELCRLQILNNWTYFPAYVDGKYVEATTDATITLVDK